MRLTCRVHWVKTGKVFHRSQLLSVMYSLLPFVAYSGICILQEQKQCEVLLCRCIACVYDIYAFNKMHDRYAFPAMGFCFWHLFSVTDFKTFIMYALVTLSQFFNTAWVLFVYEKSERLLPFRTCFDCVFNKCRLMML